MKKNRLLGTATALTMCVFLSACDMSTPSQLHTGKIQLKEKYETVILEADKVQDEKIKHIIKEYRGNGNGRLSLLVSYNADDPKSKSKSTKLASQYKNIFRKAGLSNFEIESVPMEGKYLGGQVIITYRSLQASAPDRCVSLPGKKGAVSNEEIKDYTMGCEVQDMVSRMVARPSDLLGRSGTPDGLSRRQGAITEGYHAGEPTEPLDVLQASEVGAE